ncbi:Cytochrome aa3-type quinol oxidase subunit IV [Oleidesulfovibrio alaskensis G20]|jgi:cytochrome c oxidase subunit 4|uniref:Cytochrome aa3-type quinol oxidase subunit IV n=1 Tax=Oleidesulfovibrio alaskensis (strain ATCC BAA-1058 / DSM 17464 / G20) TaxID=207559 RepID=Q310M4_OLEA2|nr:cytochrome C oxidase subunit IV family protein [Oleidesulfovibrio alaskensis]ABB38622.1 Cytochrome aa3-type quinol oxidase subunit IV [Oleidesulfovibrio alaskensis G20]MBG0773896.1 cytochrome C oxidase subunit IV family protein [Oleidesulfovibrio alaskensis]MBL3581634.1 cytochrome C oxidase subunit IV family protein [Oleidesulfovibrio alaskensis]MBL3588113.1 cytochrome C oxidase subunit IV family protein [bacterium]
MSAEHHHIVSFRQNTIIWLVLLVFTAITVAASRFDFGFLNIVVALGIATCKAGLVTLYFMHLRYEGNLIRLMVFIAFAILAIAIGFTFFDVAYR